MSHVSAQEDKIRIKDRFHKTRVSQVHAPYTTDQDLAVSREASLIFNFLIGIIKRNRVVHTLSARQFRAHRLFELQTHSYSLRRSVTGTRTTFRFTQSQRLGSYMDQKVQFATWHA